MAAILHERLLCTSQIEASTSLPRATPWAFEFLENFCSNFPLHRAEKRFKCPHPQENYQITIQTFQ